MDNPTEKQLKEQAEELEERLEDIERVEEEEFGETRDIENTPEDDAEEAETGGRLSALRDSLSTRLHQVKIALHKMRDNSYGVCDRCGEGINHDRLRAVPEAGYCISCARELETYE